MSYKASKSKRYSPYWPSCWSMWEPVIHGLLGLWKKMAAKRALQAGKRFQSPQKPETRWEATHELSKLSCLCCFLPVLKTPTAMKYHFHQSKQAIRSILHIKLGSRTFDLTTQHRVPSNVFLLEPQAESNVAAQTTGTTGGCSTSEGARCLPFHPFRVVKPNIYNKSSPNGLFSKEFHGLGGTHLERHSCFGHTIL